MAPRCSRFRKLSWPCWLAANSIILETGGGGVTDTSERSLLASLCCVIGAGDAVVEAGEDANQVASRPPCATCSAVGLPPLFCNRCTPLTARGR